MGFKDFPVKCCFGDHAIHIRFSGERFEQGVITGLWCDCDPGAALFPNTCQFVLGVIQRALRLHASSELTNNEYNFSDTEDVNRLVDHIHHLNDHRDPYRKPFGMSTFDAFKGNELGRIEFKGKFRLMNIIKDEVPSSLTHTYFGMASRDQGWIVTFRISGQNYAYARKNLRKLLEAPSIPYHYKEAVVWALASRVAYPHYRKYGLSYCLEHLAPPVVASVLEEPFI